MGFTVIKADVGTITVTFTPPFSAVPTCTGTADRTVGATATSIIITNPTLYGNTGGVSATTVQFQRYGGAIEDGYIDFVAIGPS